VLVERQNYFFVHELKSWWWL